MQTFAIFGMSSKFLIWCIAALSVFDSVLNKLTPSLAVSSKFEIASLASLYSPTFTACLNLYAFAKPATSPAVNIKASYVPASVIKGNDNFTLFENEFNWLFALSRFWNLPSLYALCNLSNSFERSSTVYNFLVVSLGSKIYVILFLL